MRYYDAINLGDDVFLKILLERYSNHFLISYTAYTKVGRAYPNAVARNRRNKTAIFLAKLLRRVMRKLYYTIPDQLDKGDILLCIGGSLFMENNNLAAWRREALFYKKLPHPYYILGSNIGPYQSPEFLDIVRSIFRGAEDVCLRDSYSHRLVKDVPQAWLATDIVLMLDTAPYTIEDNGSYVISVIDARRKFDNSIVEKYDKMIAAFATKLLTDDQESSVILMSFCQKEGDETACKRIFSRLSYAIKKRTTIYSYRGDIDGALQTLASARAIVGSRFHANILGMVFGKKILPIAYSDKTINILTDMKYTGPVVDIRAIDKFDLMGIDFQDIDILNIAPLRPLAEQQFRLLDTVLERKNS